MSSSGTSAYPQKVSPAEYESIFAHKPQLTLNAVLDLAASHLTEPVKGIQEINGSYSSAIAAQDASGVILAVYLSEPMFETPEGALDHAEDLLGSELFAIINDYRPVSAPE